MAAIQRKRQGELTSAVNRTSRPDLGVQTGCFLSSHKQFAGTKSNRQVWFCNGWHPGKQTVPNSQSGRAVSGQTITCDNIVLEISSRKGIPQRAAVQEVLCFLIIHSKLQAKSLGSKQNKM